ncbi:MAG: hypothetical protein GC185_08565 [Alphaproteobacteria bacterium]|nr:hypothetical protein [Alphaproteobacteria bacterium]
MGYIILAPSQNCLRYTQTGLTTSGIHAVSTGDITRVHVDRNDEGASVIETPGVMKDGHSWISTYPVAMPLTTLLDVLNAAQKHDLTFDLSTPEKQRETRKLFESGTFQPPRDEALMAVFNKMARELADIRAAIEPKEIEKPRLQGAPPPPGKP